MKKTYFTFLLFLAIFTSVSVKAQTNVTSSGMSIQGIARDENNAAIANIDQLGLVFTVYYLGAGNSEQLILTKTANVRTDNFGVFSYVLDIDQLQYNLISTQSAYLKVTQGSTVFSNEKLQAVPYAIFAQNGVPTGAIMPFVGTVVPNGWLLCDGSAIPVNTNTASLRALLGTTTTPDLRAMFLRGTGTSNGHSGPAIRTVQEDDLKSHLHGVDLNTNNAGSHSHTTGFANDDFNGTAGNNQPVNHNGLEDDTFGNNNRTLPTNTAGNHAHNVTGNTSNTGGTETRPVNYGVNYIIKI